MLFQLAEILRLTSLNTSPVLLTPDFPEPQSSPLHGFKQQSSIDHSPAANSINNTIQVNSPHPPAASNHHAPPPPQTGIRVLKRLQRRPLRLGHRRALRTPHPKIRLPPRPSGLQIRPEMRFLHPLQRLQRLAPSASTLRQNHRPPPRTHLHAQRSHKPAQPPGRQPDTMVVGECTQVSGSHA